jgi:hypothetical protein
MTITRIPRRTRHQFDVWRAFAGLRPKRTILSPPHKHRRMSRGDRHCDTQRSDFLRCWGRHRQSCSTAIAAEWRIRKSCSVIARMIVSSLVKAF